MRAAYAAIKPAGAALTVVGPALADGGQRRGNCVVRNDVRERTPARARRDVIMATGHRCEKSDLRRASEVLLDLFDV